MKYTEDQLKSFELPAPDARQKQACQDAVHTVQDALTAYSPNLRPRGGGLLVPDTNAYYADMFAVGSNMRLRILLQGSSANKTEVGPDSEIDVAVIQTSVKVFPRWPYAAPTYENPEKASRTLKNLVQEALTWEYGDNVEGRDKSVHVNGNTFRKGMNVVPAMLWQEENVKTEPIGTAILTNWGDRIVNYPDQHIQQVRRKDAATSGLYKKAVRTLKAIHADMTEDRESAALHVNSFQIESMLWNVPEDLYLKGGSKNRTDALFQLYVYLRDADYRTFREANGIKPLENTDGLKQFIQALGNFVEPW